MIVYITLDEITKEVELPDSKNQVEAAKKIIAKHFKVSWIRQKLYRSGGIEVKNDEYLADGEEYKMRAIGKEAALKEGMEEIYEYEEVYYYYSDSDVDGSMYDEYDDDDSDNESGAQSSDNQHIAELM